MLLKKFITLLKNYIKTQIISYLFWSNQSHFANSQNYKWQKKDATPKKFYLLSYN